VRSTVGERSGLTERLRARAREEGLALFGVADATPSEHIPFYRSWIDAGGHGSMSYLARDDAIGRRADLRATLPSVRSVVVVGDEYEADESPEAARDPSRGVVARYARGRDYHRVLRAKLRRLLSWLDAEVEGGVTGRAYVDTGPVLERELARRAGIGWFGRNTMLIHPRRGSYFFLGVLLVDTELDRAGGEPVADHCGTCRACLDACPTGALLGRDSEGAPRIDARRCISYLTIELRGPIPEELRPAIGNRVFGCDICQEVCPWNSPKFVGRSGDRDYSAEWRSEPHPFGVPADLPGTRGPSLVDLMVMTREDWDLWTRGSAIRRAGFAGFKRNVAVALGNWLADVDEPPEAAVAALVAASRDEDALIREHAGWALRRMDPGRGRRS